MSRKDVARASGGGAKSGFWVEVLIWSRTESADRSRPLRAQVWLRRLPPGEPFASPRLERDGWVRSSLGVASDVEGVVSLLRSYGVVVDERVRAAWRRLEQKRRRDGRAWCATVADRRFEE